MPQYDAPHWLWGPGYCEKHRGQGLPCKTCIEAGDVTITVDNGETVQLSGGRQFLVEDNTLTEAQYKDLKDDPTALSTHSGWVEWDGEEVVDIKSPHWKQSAGDPNAQPVFENDLHRQVSEAVNALPKGNPCAEIALPSDAGIGKRLGEPKKMGGMLVLEGLEPPTIKGRYDCYVNEKYIGSAEVNIVSEGKNEILDCTLKAHKPVTRDEMEPGVPYQNHWGSSIDDDGRPGAFFSKEDIKKALKDKEAFAFTKFEGFPYGSPVVDEVGVAGNPSPIDEVRDKKAATLHAFGLLVGEIERVIRNRDAARAAATKLATPVKCMIFAHTAAKDYCLPWNDDAITGWGHKLVGLWKEWREAKSEYDWVRARQFGELYGGRGLKSCNVSDEELKLFKEAFSRLYPTVAEFNKQNSGLFSEYKRFRDERIKPATAVNVRLAQEIQEGLIADMEADVNAKMARSMQIEDETSAFKNPKHLEALRRINEQGGPLQAEQSARPGDGDRFPDMDSHDPDAR